MKFTYRKYQEEAVECGLEVLRDLRGRREILCLPTAAGKSLIIAGIANQLTDGNILVLQPDKNILEQNLSKIESFGVYPAVYSASVKRKELGHLIYATPKSVSYEILKDANIKYCIIDEVDHGSKNDSHIVKMLKKLGVKSILGTTATPIHIDSSGQDGSVARVMTQIKKPFFTDICYVVSAEEMISNKFWSDIKYYNVYKEEAEDILKLNSSGSEYTEESTETFFDKMNLAEEVKNFLLRLPENENALVFVPSINNLEQLQKILVGSVGVHSKMNPKLRVEYTEGFKSGKYKIMISVSSMNVGFDFPELKNIVDCSPTNSVRIKIQRDGRILRIHKDKDFGRIICFSGNYKRFGDCRDFNFDKIEGYGWGLFSKDKLLTDVPLNSKQSTTKEYLRKHKKPLETFFEFTKEHDGLIKMSCGKMKGITLKRLYFTKRYYLKWLMSSGFNFKHEDREFERQLKIINDKVF